jgi:hypothetical protein
MEMKLLNHHKSDYRENLRCITISIHAKILYYSEYIFGRVIDRIRAAFGGGGGGSGAASARGFSSNA